MEMIGEEEERVVEISVVRRWYGADSGRIANRREEREMWNLESGEEVG